MRNPQKTYPRNELGNCNLKITLASLRANELTHCNPVTQDPTVYISLRSGNGLSSVRRQKSWNKKYNNFTSTKMHLKMTSTKWRHIVQVSMFTMDSGGDVYLWLKWLSVVLTNLCVFGMFAILVEYVDECITREFMLIVWLHRKDNVLQHCAKI